MIFKLTFAVLAGFVLAVVWMIGIGAGLQALGQ